MRWTQKTWMLVAALVAIALYLPTLPYDFSYDSVTEVRDDTFIHQPQHFADVLTLRVLSMDVLDFNRPLQLLTLMIDSLLWGKNPAGYRFTNILLHGAAVALLFRWLFLLTGNRLASLLAALLFAVHPLHCEAVVEISNRKDLLATFFLLAGLNAAAAFQPGEKRKTWGPALLTVACLFLSVASKESGIAGPVVLAAYWFLFRRENRQTRRSWLLLIAASALAVGAFLTLRFALESHPSLIFDPPPSFIAPTALGWLQIQSRIWAAEFLRIVWPAHLCADYGPYNLRNIDPVWALLGLLTLTVAVIVASLRNRKIALASALFVAAMLPVSNLVPIYRPMADRFLYLPMTGVALALAVALATLLGPRKKSRETARTLISWGTLAIIAVLAAVTFHQQPVWRNHATLWQETSLENPFSFNAWLGRGYSALDAGKPQQAITEFQHASALAHDQSAEIFAAIALAEDDLGHPREAAESLAYATKLDSRYARPDTLVRALIFPAYRADRFPKIARQTSSP